MSEDAFEGWALVELMGHRRRVGYVRQVESFGAKLLRIDIPAEGDDVTEFYGGGAIYALRPCSEEIARAQAAQMGDPRPVRPLEFRIEAPRDADDDDDYSDVGL
ncbi:hypothetical protein [Amorphus sp. 3PC139-8]|uniref:hypothetical protein n=1 Tax=Amorphus sp. 3PC139-8 TaxID=2735676 RepID=UPI00345CDCC0